MTLDERIIWLLLGVVIGLFMGYLTRTLRDIREGVKEVDSFLKTNSPPRRDESGAFKLPTWRGLAVFAAVAFTAIASFQSQAASNNADESLKRADASQDQLEQVVSCIIVNQTNFLDAVNTRTTYTQSQAKANKKLQEAQKVFFGILLHIPPYTQERRTEAAREYQIALDNFLDAANASEKNAVITKYPLAEDLLSCIEEKTHEKEK